MIKLEICANGFQSARHAQQGGAHRVELCDNLLEGGTTPSYAQIKKCVEELQIEVWPILRPRGGDFCYSEEEFDLMKTDLLLMKEMGCHGAVTGILTLEGHVDELRCAELIALAKPMPLAFHRAFDMAADLAQALELLISLGFVRVLSSGARQTAYEGRWVLKSLVEQAKKRIEIMPGAGIDQSNVLSLVQQVGCSSVHASCSSSYPSNMKHQNLHTRMGDMDRAYEYRLSDEAKIKTLIHILNTDV